MCKPNCTIILSNGQAATVPEGADPTIFRRLCEAKLHPAPAKKRTPTSKRKPTVTGKSQRSRKAAMNSAVGWATVELVKRVNGKGSTVSDEEIPFDGSGPADDQEGTEAGYGIPSPF